MKASQRSDASSASMKLVPTVQADQDIRLFAIATRERHSSLIREAVAIRKQSKNRVEAVRQYLRQFRDQGLLTRSEMESLSAICEVSIGSNVITDEHLARALRLYHELIDSGSNPLAVAIAGVAVSSMEVALAAETDNAAGITGSDVSGAIAGASAGSKVPNPYGPVGGAVGGAVIGGGVASLLAWWES